MGVTWGRRLQVASGAAQFAVSPSETVVSYATQAQAGSKPRIKARSWAWAPLACSLHLGGEAEGPAGVLTRSGWGPGVQLGWLSLASGSTIPSRHYPSDLVLTQR